MRAGNDQWQLARRQTREHPIAQSIPNQHGIVLGCRDAVDALLQTVVSVFGIIMVADGQKFQVDEVRARGRDVANFALRHLAGDDFQR